MSLVGHRKQTSKTCKLMVIIVCIQLFLKSHYTLEAMKDLTIHLFPIL